MVDGEKVWKTHSKVTTVNLDLNICKMSLKVRLSLSQAEDEKKIGRKNKLFVKMVTLL